MSPKESSNSKKREAEGDSTAASGDSNSNSLRRSTRGGGHSPAASANEKPASQPNPRSSKKAKVEGGETATAPVEEEPAAGEDTNVAVPKENKEIAAAAAQQNGKSKNKRLEVGETLPAGLVLKNEMDQEIKVEELTKEKGAVFFVYPKANTPGCTTQACNFRDQYSEFGPLGYEVYGLSGDSPKSQSTWKTKHSFPYHLLCDPNQILLSLLGAVKSPKSNQRSHYIVEKGGKILDAKYTVSPKDSTKLALEFIKGLQKDAENGGTEEKEKNAQGEGEKAGEAAVAEEKKED